MDDKDRLFIYGASGHAKVVIDIVERQGLYTIAFLVDDDPALAGREFFGYPVLGGKEALLLQKAAPGAAIVAIGNNLVRLQVAHWLQEQGVRLVSGLHPAAVIGRGVVIGAGSVVMANAVINPDARLGENVIINTGATVDHDCVLAAGVHVAPGATLCGAVRVGSTSFIGAGATVIPGRVVGDNATVGAGATVVRDVPAGATVIGCPAK